MDFVRLEKHEDGVLFAFIENPRDRVNTLSEQLISEIEGVLDEVETDHFAKALVFISGKKDNFIAGADIRDFDRMSEPGHASEILARAHALFNRISNLHYPSIAAINGACLGGGLELALACHFRIATDSNKTVLGLPEVTLGILPAAGGTQRLTRTVGIKRALPLMLTGKSLSAAEARSLRLVDILVYPEDLPVTVKRCVPFLRKKFPMKVSYPAVFSLDWLLATIPPVRKLYFDAARRRVARHSDDHYPAPFRIIDCVEAGVAGTMSDGFKAEIEGFGPLVVSPQSQSLRRLFFVRTALKRKHYGAEPRQVDLLGVVGSGFMGTGIAAVSAQSGYKVAIKDVSQENLSMSLKEIWQSLDRRARSRKLNPVKRDKLYSLVIPTLDYANLAGAGLIIEAVFEDLAIKHQVMREVESITSPESIFASNTSAIPISRIAEASIRPENVIGMHYFSPVQKMPLLEVIATERCADWVLATAVSVGRRQGKTVIVVRDGPGFYTTRILTPFVLEAIKLIEEGAAVEEVDAAIRMFGFPVGPLELLDEVGIDVAAHVVRELEEFFAHRDIHAPPALELILKSGYAGKKKGTGFYDHQPRLIDRVRIPGLEHSKPVNSNIYGFFDGEERKSIDSSQIWKRLVYLMVNEAAMCLQQGTISCPEDGDVGAVFGLGFPPFLGGPFRYLDSAGIGRIVSEMEDLSSTHGPRFEPVPILVHMAEQEETFYGHD
ncbi:MAG: 3-hydroxyacyl-CoA dehydrogenase NAD-binding domain-containing protein [Syntrophobacteraceae bacterium]|jgi:3-hydroxyacyl-CoA dehydrogenase/enoyl-CoA hydratase/3-hydroxybutyryl-CoA epimerase